MATSAGSFDPDGAWWWGFRHREEAARGLDDQADLYAAGTFGVDLGAGDGVDLVFEALGPDEEPTQAPGPASLELERERQRVLLASASAGDAPVAVQQLALAADQFLVERRLPDGATVPTVIAGYPWFNDWGRD